ncbi:MAG: hypothetical protein RBT33_01915 [Candidatus Dojkabacteria bacterium]|jgi:NADH:ubiquinone oxidoreductase subunit 6 (subunit J)|nr:hypothetical protein [Candidatus Dojkabacteria bacterium]
MSEITGIVISIVAFMIPIAIGGTVVYLIVQAVKNKGEKDGKNVNLKISAKTLFQVYLYLISFLTLIIAVIGGATAIKAGLSYQFGVPFSYTLYKGSSFAEEKVYNPTLELESFKVCSDGEPITIGTSDYCINYQQQTTDLVNGLTIFVSMLILFAIHQFAISKIEGKKRLQWLEKLYTFVSLILYSIIGLVSIPTSIYQLTNYLLTKPENYSYSTPAAPAMAIAMVLLSLPLWIYFLGKTSNLKDEN